MKKLILIIALISLLASCVFLPRHAKDQPQTCHLYTKELELKLVDSGRIDCRDEVCFAVAIGTSVATLVVSGSIVVVGNVVHWLEKQGRCSDEFIDERVEAFREEYDPDELDQEYQDER